MSLLIIVGKMNYFAVLCLKAVVDIDISTTLVCLVKEGPFLFVSVLSFVSNCNLYYHFEGVFFIVLCSCILLDVYVMLE